MIELKATISAEYVTFSLEENNKQITLSQWNNLEQGSRSLLLEWMRSDSDNVSATDCTINVSMTKIAQLTDDMASDLCLPKPVSVVMHIRNEGIITQQNFHFSYEWQKDGRARPIAGVKRIGCFLRIGTEYFRLPYQLFKIAEGIEKINAVLPDKIQDRLLALNEIQSYLPDETTRSITMDGLLNSTKVYSAHAFELTVQQSTDGIDFDPVLLYPKKNDETNFYQDSMEFEKLLTPEDQKKFAALFRKNTECRSNYALSSGRYIIFSEQLQKTLAIVRKMQNSSLDNKLEFLKNPKALLTEAGISEGMLERIFSERIEGYGERQIKIIPWIKIEGQEWLPNENSPKGLMVGDKTIPLSVSECAELEEKLRNAIKSGDSTVEYKGTNIPANSNSLASLAEISPIKPEKKQKKPSIEENVETNTINFKNYVLYVKDNFSDIKYRPSFKSRNGIQPFELTPAMLKNALKPHQLDGVKWLVQNYQAGVSGVLLADDMGLGKTFQALTFLAWIRENIEQFRIPNRPILIVAPTGLLNNWKQEHDRHLHEPGLGDLIHAYGTNLNSLRDHTQVNALVKPLNTQKLKEADWILTTYETLSNYQTGFAGVHYAAVIFDEMQKIKTPNTRITEAAQTINADFIIGMTGTPIENRLADLWCLVDTLQPARLGTLQQFSTKYEKGFSKTISKQLKDELTEPTNEIPPFMLRRMKDTSLDGLPKIYHHDAEELMSKIQADAYMQILDEAKKSDESGRHLEALHNLRRVSLHPHGYRTGINDESFISESARLRATFRILDDIYKKREKVLIFIEFREWHQSDFLPAILKRRYGLSELPMVISGAVKGSDRQKRVDSFQENSGEFDVMLLSPRAGGVGLTLTKANHVIHLSRWWNPAVEDQCTDRAYRIGQEKDVHVYYPMAKHPELGNKSFDSCLKQLLTKKRELSRTLLIPPISDDDINQLKNSVIFNHAVLDNNHTTNFSLNEINCMEPFQFSDWIANECKNVGLIVKKPPRTWDGGADLIIENTAGEIVAIIQCKHAQQGKAPYTAISDLLRACDSYNVRKVKLIAVTNASQFNAAAEVVAEQHDQIILIDAANILNVGKAINDAINNFDHRSGHLPSSCSIQAL
jgi:SNF2 family DNA or RNA helicase